MVLLNVDELDVDVIEVVNEGPVVAWLVDTVGVQLEFCFVPTILFGFARAVAWAPGLA